jgi:hypothetical protein
MAQRRRERKERARNRRTPGNKMDPIFPDSELCNTVALVHESASAPR